MELEELERNRRRQQHQRQRQYNEEEDQERSWRMTFILGVPTLLLPVPLIMGNKAGWCVYCMFWMAMYWTTEIIPLPATAMMPLALFPIMGLLSTDDTSKAYFNDIGFMTLSSLTVAVAVEATNLHKRVALKALLVFGMSKRRIIFAIMMISMFLSLWIPNTASASIMAPITMAIADQMQRTASKYQKGIRRQEVDVGQPEEKEQPMKTHDVATYVRKMMLLSVTYACNVGGTGSLIGTAPNQILKSVFDERFPLSRDLSYAYWMMTNGPTMLLLVLLSYAYVQWNIERKGGAEILASAAETRLVVEVTRKYNELGTLTFAEAMVLLLTVVMVILLMTMDPRIFAGWSIYFPVPRFIRASVPMMFVSLLMFVVPRDPRMQETVPILTWEEVNKRVSWGTILIISGGMSIAEASKASGLASTVTNTLAVLHAVPQTLVLSALCLIASFATELASNSAVSSLMIPVVIDMAVLMNVHPLYYALPVTICCSFSFMMPCATPINAIVYQLGQMTPLDMARPGILMNLMTVAGEIVSVHWFANYFLSLDKVPWWARTVSPGSNLTQEVTARRLQHVPGAGRAALLAALRRPVRP